VSVQKAHVLHMSNISNTLTDDTSHGLEPVKLWRHPSAFRMNNHMFF
jgi:hypothetical protein